MNFLTVQIICCLNLWAAAPSEVGDIQQFEMDTSAVILRDVPLKKVTLSLYDQDHQLISTYQGSPQIQGIELLIKGEPVQLPRFQDGTLELKTDLAKNQKVYLRGSEITILDKDIGQQTINVTQIPGWLSLLPPLIAVVISIWLKNVLVALFGGVFLGTLLMNGWNPLLGFQETLHVFLFQEGLADQDHLMIILFTLFLGAMVGVITAGGGAEALIKGLARWTKTREQGQLMTSFLGVLIFFDDYANTLLVGGTMRPVTDRLKISREKLAFLVDSTAAPIAGLAIISTWVGVEIGYISDTFTRLGITGDVYPTFLGSILYRFYPIYLLFFVFLIARTGRDFGPMYQAELNAQQEKPPRVSSPEQNISFEQKPPQRLFIRNAVIPLLILFSLILIGLWSTGRDALELINLEKQNLGQETIPYTLWNILGEASLNQVLFLSAFVASVSAIICVVSTRTLTLAETMTAWEDGAKTMFSAALILVLAWAIAAVCDQKHLNTAGYLVELSQQQLSVYWMPTLSFLLAAIISFATGSSWSTMGLLMPLCISMCYSLLMEQNHDVAEHPLMLGTIGAVLTGAIFGDHCSPISDTTVLSSAATGCDHLRHVGTQFPYALTVAVVALGLGYLPLAWGVPVWLLLPLGLGCLFFIVRFGGKKISDSASAKMDSSI